MNQLTPEYLYSLLPAIYRLRDYEAGGPLKVYLEVLAEQAGAVEQDIAQLYDDWFIETCAEWVVPYIGEQMAVRGLRAIEGELPFSQRAIVANTLAYRRRKGTPSVLEQLAYDASGYRAHVVEAFVVMDTTQHVNHVRLQAVRTPDLRRTGDLELIGTALDKTYKTADVRGIENPRPAALRGKENIQNIALYLWRLQSYRLARSDLVSVSAGQFCVHPSGGDMPLFNSPQTETDIGSISQEQHLPVPLRRRVLFDELESRRAAMAQGLEPVAVYFDTRAELQVFELLLDGDPVRPEELMVCDLSQWHMPPALLSYDRQEANGTLSTVDFPIKAAIDPQMGRLALAPDFLASTPWLSFAYGFSTDTGGGAYSRQRVFQEWLQASGHQPQVWQLGVSTRLTPVADELVTSLNAAIDAWHLQPPGTVGLITVMESARFTENWTGANRIRVPAGSRLMITAADWPELPVIDGLPGERRRQTARINAAGVRPTLVGDVEIEGESGGDGFPGEITLDGFYIDGDCRVVDGNLGQLNLSHCTLQAPEQGVTVNGDNASLSVRIDRCIAGPVTIAADIVAVRVQDSILMAEDPDGSAVLTAPDVAAVVCESTLLGAVAVEQIRASNSIFIGAVTVERRQEGCVRFCYLPSESLVPKRHRCQPEREPESLTNAQFAALAARLRPSFTSLDVRAPGFAQLSEFCANEIATGADNGSEMGAFNRVHHPARMANARNLLRDYLRFGLQAGFFFET